MDNVAQELLNQIPTGAELLNPRAGNYENAILSDVKELEDGSGVNLVFTGLQDQEGNDFDHPFRVTFPTSNDGPDKEWLARQFLALLHDLQLVELKDKSRRLIDTPEVKEATIALFKTLIGTSYSFKLKESSKGYLNLYFQRQKK